MNAEFAIGSAFKFAIGRMIFDPLPVVAEAIALMQNRAMLVGKARALVERTAGKRTKPVKVRLDMLKQRRRQIDAKQIGEDRIGSDR